MSNSDWTHKDLKLRLGKVTAKFMKIQLRPSHPFDLDLTLCCGQAFRWEKQGDWWQGLVKGNVLKVRQTGRELEFENVDEDFIVDYFGLEDDLLRIFFEIRKDQHIGAAIDHCEGLRLLRQEPWECLISYICATFKNIASIKRMLLALSRKFGEETHFEGRSYYKFPRAEELASASLKALVECELGYRAKYISQTAKMVCDDVSVLQNLREMAYDEAKRTLLDFPGVGQKVADCVLLFSLNKPEAFPVDVWVRRVIIRHYARHFPQKLIHKISKDESLSDSEYRLLNLFGRQYFGRYAGYAQEYLYHYERACSKT
jgi:N-glycosylase/DNA lyase